MWTKGGNTLEECLRYKREKTLLIFFHRKWKDRKCETNYTFLYWMIILSPDAVEYSIQVFVVSHRVGMGRGGGYWRKWISQITSKLYTCIACSTYSLHGHMQTTHEQGCTAGIHSAQVKCLLLKLKLYVRCPELIHKHLSPTQFVCDLVICWHLSMS